MQAVFRFLLLLCTAGLAAGAVSAADPTWVTKYDASLAQEVTIVDETSHKIGASLRSDRGSQASNFKVDTLERQDSSTSICERKKKQSVFVFGKCPSKCEPFSLAAYYDCVGRVSFGCELQPCGPGKFSCSLKKNLAKDVIVCPGDKIVFDSVPLKDLQNVKFNIDLRAPPLQTDFYLLSDATGSMGTAIGVVKAKINDILKIFGSRSNVAFGLGYYRDERELVNGFKNLESITLSRSKIQNAVASLRARGGRDRDEANLVALYKVATDSTIGWREGARKFLVYFGDYPGHEPSCNRGLPKLTREVVVDALKKKGITVVGIDFGYMDSRAPISYGCSGSRRSKQVSYIAKGTSGSTLKSTNQKELVALISKAISNVTRKFDVDQTSCIANVDATFDPKMPIVLKSGATATVEQTIKIKPGVCAAGGNFNCQYKYTEFGASIGKSTIEVVNVKGC